MAIGESDELFDFSDQMFTGPSKKESEMESNPTPFKDPIDPTGTPVKFTYDKEVQTSFLLTNALMNLLIRKQIIYPHEVQTLVAELHIEYMKMKKKGQDDNGAK